MTAHWFNPAKDAALIAHGPALPNQDGQKLRTPGDNGTGTNDWALVLKGGIQPLRSSAAHPHYFERGGLRRFNGPKMNPDLALRVRLAPSEADKAGKAAAQGPLTVLALALLPTALESRVRAAEREVPLWQRIADALFLWVN